MACSNAFVSSISSFVIFGVALRPAQDSFQYDSDQTKEKEQGNFVGSRRTMSDFQGPRLDVDGWEKLENYETQKWATFKTVMGSGTEILPGHFDDQMRELQESFEQPGLNVADGRDMLWKENKRYAETQAVSNAEKDVVGTWLFTNHNRSAAFSIQTEGAQLVLMQNLDGKLVKALLKFAGEWWYGQGDVSSIGGASADVIRIRWRGDRLICNTRGPDDWQWRETIVAFKDGDDPALCDDIVTMDSKVNLAAAKRCLDRTGFVYIQLPNGEHIIDEPFVIKSRGTLLVQGNQDKAGAILKCSRGHPAFVFEDAAELILESLVVDSCGGKESHIVATGVKNMDGSSRSDVIHIDGSGAIHAEDKENLSLRLQHGALIRNSVGHGVCIRGDTNSSNFFLDDHSMISGSGLSGLNVEGGHYNTFYLRSSMITGCAEKGVVAKQGTHTAFLLENFTINGSGGSGINVYRGESYTISLVYSTINGSLGDGLSILGGDSHTFSLGNSTINGSGKHGLKLSSGEKHTVIVGHSTIHGSRHDGLSIHGGDNHTLSLWHSTIYGSGKRGLQVKDGEKHTVNLGYSTIHGSRSFGLLTTKGDGHTLSLWQSTIYGSGLDGLRMEGGERHTVNLVYSTVNRSGKNGFTVDKNGDSHTVSLGYSTIDGSKHDGLAIMSGARLIFSLAHSTINDSRRHGISALAGDNLIFNLGHSAIHGSGRDGLSVALGRSGRSTTFSLGDSTIDSSGRDGLLVMGGHVDAFSLGNCTINGSRRHGVRITGGENHTISLGYSKIYGSGQDGVQVEGKNHIFSLGYSAINGSGKNGLSSQGENHTLSLWHSTINGSGKHGLRALGQKHTCSLGYCTISSIVDDGFFAGGSILIGGCAFKDCGGIAVCNSGSGGGENMMIMNTNIHDSRSGFNVRRGANVTIKNSTFWNIIGDAVSSSTALLYTDNVSVYASGTAFRLGNMSWEGSSTTVMGNGNGITCSHATRGTLASSFVFLNSFHDRHNCDRLVLGTPLPTKVHAEKLQSYLYFTLLILIGLTAVLPIIQDRPREFHECSWILLGFSSCAAVIWLTTITMVLWTVYLVFQREEDDEGKYGADARAWGVSFALILVAGILITVLAVVVAVLSRKKYSVLRSTAQFVLDTQEQRKRQQDLAQQRGEYTNKLQEYHEAMVNYVSRATSCKSTEEGQQYLTAAKDQFDHMKTLARDEGKVLDSKLHRDVQQTYKDDPLRWQTLLDIESLSQKSRYQGEHMIPFSKVMAGNLTPINTDDLNEEATRHLLLAASWGRSVFQKSLENVADRLNKSNHIDDLIHELSNQFPIVAEQLKQIIPEVRDLKLRRYKLLRDIHATFCGQHCNVVMGPNKTHHSASRKAAKYHDEHEKKPPKDAPNWQMPAARYMLDLLRATVVFSDPVALVVFFHLLATEFTVVSTKNKYKDPLEKGGSPSILVNIEVDTILGKLTTEVQLYLDKFLDLKCLAHTNYEVDRVRDLLDLLSPFQH